MDEAAKVVGFVEAFCTLGGSFLGQPFKVLPFARELIGDLYRPGPDGGRLRREYLLGVPRKNTKSTTAAALAVYHLFMDPYNAAPQVISAAGDRLQAKIVFGEAKRMIQASPSLLKRARVYKDHVETKSGGFYRAVSADAALQQGLNPSFVVFDELHVFKNDELVEALTMGSAMRRSPLFLYITTAGHDKDSPLGRKYEYGRRVESGEVVDPSFGFMWYGPQDGEAVDPDEREAWRRYNPAADLMPDFEASMEADRKTKHVNAFIRYRLNGWTSTQSAWLPFGAWDRLADPGKRLVPGDPVILGFDGAWKGDSTALVGVRMTDYHTEVIGHWEAPPGDREWRTPVREVTDAILRAIAVFDVKEVVCDPWRFEQTISELRDKGYPLFDFPTNSATRMGAATQGGYEAVMDGTFSHDGHPALARHVANCILREDSRGSRIVKQHKNSRQHIDLAVAWLIARHRVRWYEEQPAPPKAGVYLLDV